MAVQVRIEDLHHPEGGHARVVFSGTGHVAAEWVVIRRFDHQENYLSPEGWRGPETHIAPLEIEPVPGGIAVVLGPDVTEWLEYGERIAIGLVDTTFSAAAIWPEIGSWIGQRRSGRRVATGAPTRPKAPAAPQRPPQQQTVVPGMQATVIAPRPVIAPPPPPAPLAPPPPAPPPVAAVASAPPVAATARRRNSLIAAVVLLLILGAGGGYYGYHEWLRPPDGPTGPNPPTPPTPPGQLDLASLVNRPPEEVFRMGEALYAQGSYTIAFSLFDDASRRGYAPAHTRIATFYDPATFQADRPFQRPNPRKALEHFDAAIAAGDQNASGPREALVARLREAARGTDPAAREAQAVLRDMRL